MAKGKTVSGPQVPMAVMIPLIAAAILLVGGIGYRTLFYTPGTATAAQMEKQTQDQDFLKQKARECSGDFSKLSPADQKKVNEITAGRGEFAIRTVGNH